MFKARSTVILGCLLIASSAAAHAQKSAAEELSLARPTYYTPTADGLQSLHCDLDVDWKAVFATSGSKPVADDNPLLVYLKTVRLSVDDSLQGSGALVWRQAAAPPESVQKNVDQMHTAFGQMIEGFYQSWNSFMNGSMVPIPDSSTTVTRTADGLHLHATADNTVVDEDFDKKVLLTRAHVVTPALDVVMNPVYAQTPQGRLVTTLDSSYRQPATAAPVQLIMTVEYQQVSGFRIPVTLHIGITNSAKFDFKFANCSVGKAAAK